MEDLRDPRFKVQYALWHRRFSTNTMPRWPLAQPFRYLGHNGEINTIQGNYNWTRARSGSFEHPNFGYRMREVLPPCRAENSDSGNMDCYLELMLRCNRELPEALMMMIPEAYKDSTRSLAAGDHHTPPMLLTTDRELRCASDFRAPWVQDNDSGDVKDFYECRGGYWGALQEAWDGPALVAFCDGEYMGATLDRNGLRPARYFQLHDGTCVVSSETGILEKNLFPPDMFKSKGRLGPGKMVAIDLHTGELIENEAVKQKMASKKPYGDWNKVFREEMDLEPFLSKDHDLVVPKAMEDNLMTLLFDMGYTIEDVEMVVESMAQTGREPTFCMGNDKPLAVLSDRAHVLYDYFTQRFAQVTNPAIDPYRESLVMSINVYLGRQGNLMAESPTYFQNKANNRLVKIDSPFLNERQLYAIKNSGLLTVQLSTRYDHSKGPGALEKAVSDICSLAALGYEASNAIRNGAELIIISDVPRNSDFLSNFDVEDPDIGLERSVLAIPPLLAVGAIHHYLIQQGLRTQASLVVSTGQCWSTHHFACLIGYGASAVCPYLALAHIRKWHATDKGAAKADGQTVEEVQRNYKDAVNAGLKKIMSKMGITVLESYRGAQIFQCIGLDKKVIDRAFCGTPSTCEALSFTDIANESMMFHRRAFPELEEKAEKLEFAGWYKYIKAKGEFHMNNPEMSRALHKAVRNNEPLQYEEYRRQIMDGRPITAIRDLLEFASDRQPVPLSEVEDAVSICSRFVTGGMSLGALSREAHEVIAVGMNRIGGMSNSGEGGEDPLRYHPIKDVDEEGHSASFPHLQGLRNGDSAASATKQVASGRFGVTAAYLRSAKQLEIKIAQGAKPGEGGQLPGAKVDDYIARLRNSVPGVELISPPPHHDIYSIEDLAQLIFDLHQVSPEAKVSVKLVASAGIGTIAAGVAKANADVIQISGHDGGTGASPLSSIMHAGSPWEQGLCEVQEVLVENSLRERVTLRVDGGIKTGWDIVVAAMMGAEEYGFGSVAMIAEGCIMARVCHMNRCPVGKKFPGTPDHIANFMLFVAEEVRTIIAALGSLEDQGCSKWETEEGYRSLAKIIGRADLLRPRVEGSVRTSVPQPAVAAVASQPPKTRKPKKTAAVDLSSFYAEERPNEEHRLSWVDVKRSSAAHSNGPVLDDDILEVSKVAKVIEENSGKVEMSMDIQNTNRALGGRIAGTIASKYGDHGFKGEIHLNFTGSAGQSFGAWNTSGVLLQAETEGGVTGDCNDYVGKGMNGGTIVAIAPPESSFPSQESTEHGLPVFFNGRVGERFGVRNAGCRAVIEGAGDHLGERLGRPSVKRGGKRPVAEAGCIGTGEETGVTRCFKNATADEGKKDRQTQWSRFCQWRPDLVLRPRYMTNGVIVALGRVGRNVAAGMSGGLLYIYEERMGGREGRNLSMLHGERMDLNADNARNVFRVTSEAGEKQLKELVELLGGGNGKHHELTGSKRAAEILEDVKAAHRLRESYAPPRQSNFRVSAVLRFTRADGSGGTLEAVNAEPHDANIRGAICAERAAMCLFQKTEGNGAEIRRVVCATDCKDPIYPGPLCREFLTSSCGPEVEIVATGSDGNWVVQPLRELFRMPSPYRGLAQQEAKAKASALGGQVKPPEDALAAKVYQAAFALARKQEPQTVVYPITFAAAVGFEDGEVAFAAELKGIEYGCTVDAASLLIPELQRRRGHSDTSRARVLMQVDNFGVAHAPFSGARSLLVEHGFGDVLVTAHGDDGQWLEPIKVKESLPHADFLSIF
ncbi:Ferredoxin-dependent glutamate synthase (Fd-GOGAT) [Durusdinium trenchii]|uniref:glutamate synthase (ferredoxin) n=1 Tax=Durusdinium trenchii TaxID=1381693 RepID=A0ABP0MJ62_9DINO